MAEERKVDREPRQPKRALLFRPEYERIRARIQAEVEKSEKSQRKLSREMGQDPTFLYRVLTLRRPLDFVEVIDLAKVLGVTPQDLFASALEEEATTP